MANDKHIFIGIGGSGCQTVSQIKEKVYEKRFKEATAAKSRLQQMNDSYRFLFIDTDQRDIDEANKRNRDSFEKGKVPFISPQTDLINLGRANPQAIYYEAKNDPTTLINKRIVEACSRELAAKIPDQPLSFGAGAFRMKSRIAFAHALTDFQSKLQAAISGLNDVKTVGGEDCIIYYWVIGSTLGGTGSGIFNDVLYHINQLHNQIVGNGDPQLVLTMYMPKVYIDSNSTEEKYALNAFGVFKELEAFKEMSFDIERSTVMHRLAFQNDYNLIDSNRRYSPFYYLIPIDIQTDKGTSLGNTHTMYRNTAEMLYHLHNGKAGSTFRSDIDNYMNDIMERDHKEFLVPMGYVSLQKPEEQFRLYMHARFKRDLLRDWLLNADQPLDENKVKAVKSELFNAIEPGTGSLAKSIVNYEQIENALSSQPSDASDLVTDLYLDNMISLVEEQTQRIKNNGKGEKRERYQKVLRESIWDAAENMIRKYGISYTHDAIDAVRKYIGENYNEETKRLKANRDAIDESMESLRDIFEKAKNNGRFESNSHNRQEIRQYMGQLETYVNDKLKNALEEWAHDMVKEIAVDEKESELAVLKGYLAKLKGKATELANEAVSYYNSKLPDKFGNAAMDVTTVYLPQLKQICDGNGWVPDNFFGSVYNYVIKSQRDKNESANRKSICDLIDNGIYNTQDPDAIKTLHRGQYMYSYDRSFNEKKKEETVPSARFFANPTLLDRNSEKILTDFVGMATDILDRKLRGNKEIQGKWYEKNVAGFFNDLTNEEKDSVRRSLNPALFFSYNSNKIDVIKKEEHIVFVAGNEDLAVEMLGYQRGNPKHRYERADSDNTALVLKSKYGLALSDYRIYDSIKGVYDKANFREKYHFHHDFSQHQENLRLSDLPDEIMPHHRSFAKILILDAFRDQLAPLFYSDEYDDDNFTTTMFETNPSNDQYFMLATPEAFSLNQKTGAPTLKRTEGGRKLFLEIEGADFAVQFKKYAEFYFNYRFGETVESLISTLLTSGANIDSDGKKIWLTGEKIFKDGYVEVHKNLLKELDRKRKQSAKEEERRINNILFNIVRDDFSTVHDFIK